MQRARRMLLYASEAGLGGVVSSLLGSNIRLPSSWIHRAFTYAAGSNHIDIVEIMIASRHQIDVNWMGKEEMSALMRASMNGHAEMTEVLLTSFNADVDAACELIDYDSDDSGYPEYHDKFEYVSGATALIHAAKNGHAADKHGKTGADARF
eukprot:jgi/Picsp_1/733/NSC_04222-R1_ankyrin repeat protein rf_0381-like